MNVWIKFCDNKLWFFNENNDMYLYVVYSILLSKCKLSIVSKILFDVFKFTISQHKGLNTSIKICVQDFSRYIKFFSKIVCYLLHENKRKLQNGWVISNVFYWLLRFNRISCDYMESCRKFSLLNCPFYFYLNFNILFISNVWFSSMYFYKYKAKCRLRLFENKSRLC